MKASERFIFLLAVLLTLSWTSVSRASDDIVIGFSGPLSGPAVEYGQDCFTGLDMAINELNAAGGITVDGKKLLFRLEKLDNKADPSMSVINARKLLSKNALVIYDTGLQQATLTKINQEECNEFIFMDYSASPKATKTGNKLQVVMNAPSTIYVQLFAEMAWERGWRKAAMVVALGAYGDDWREDFGTYWKKIGGTITIDKPANYYTKTDFTGPLTAALATNPDVMLIGGPSATTAVVIEQSRNMGYKGGFLLIEQAKFDYIAQLLDGTSLMEDAIGVVSLPTLQTPAAPIFDKKYKAIYKRPNTWETVQHYDSVYYLASAIQAANTVDDVYAIRAALPKAFPQLGNKFCNEDHGISSTGRVYTMAGVQTIKNGKFSQPEMYVWWAKTQAEFDKVQKITKFPTRLKWFKSKSGNVD